VVSILIQWSCVSFGEKVLKCQITVPKPAGHHIMDEKKTENFGSQSLDENRPMVSFKSDKKETGLYNQEELRAKSLE
jgi:hypothetical protein